MDKEILAKAMLDPPSVFSTPAAVLADRSLTKSQKIEILRRWEYDACEIDVAEEEGMPAKDDDMVQQVLQALHQLVDDINTENTPPTKQGGLGRDALSKPKQRQ